MNFSTVLLVVLCTVPAVFCVRCYQCASSQEEDDTCGAYKKFDKESHIAVDCNTDESNTQGTFCMKLTKQGPKGFIWDGRWRQVIRRCASVADTGVLGVCNWGVDDNGDYWEECYCTADECNSSTFTTSSITILISTLAVSLLYKVVM